MPLVRPGWSRSLRFSLALRWSLALLVVASVVVVGLNVALARTVGDAPAAETYRAVEKVRTESGGYRTVRELELAEVQDVEAVTNARALTTLRTYSTYALGGLFATSLLVGWLLAGRALRPVGEMTRATTLVDARDLSRRMAVRGDDELGSLGRSIDEMLGRLDDAFGRQRQFVSDASHELRTPLAVIQANVDTVLSRENVDPVERDRAVATTTRAVGRMAGLVDDMLASARSSSPGDMKDGIDLGALAREELMELEVLAEARNVRLVAMTEAIAVRGHEAALRRAVDNLVANAVRFTRPGTEVRLEVGTCDRWAFVTVTDRGPGVPTADAPQVFDRFWRGPGQEARDGHHGLGLSIVRQVAESHSGFARLHDGPGGAGSTFALWLPLDPADPGAGPTGSPLEGRTARTSTPGQA